jgi:hypothetical protein
MAQDNGALEHLAKELDKVASWHTGAREQHVRVLAEKLRSVADGTSDQWYGDAKAQADALAEAEAKLAAEKEAEAKAEAAAAAAREKAQQKANQQ